MGNMGGVISYCMGACLFRNNTNNEKDIKIKYYNI